MQQTWQNFVQYFIHNLVCLIFIGQRWEVKLSQVEQSIAMVDLGSSRVMKSNGKMKESQTEGSSDCKVK